MLVCQFLFCAEARKEVIKFYIVYAVGREKYSVLFSQS